MGFDSVRGQIRHLQLTWPVTVDTVLALPRSLWLCLHVKICPPDGNCEDHQPPLFILGPLYISETKGARKLKFGALVGLYEY